MDNNIHSRIHKFVSNAHKNQITPHNWLSTYQPDESVVAHNDKISKQREITYRLALWAKARIEGKDFHG
jgi:hypothetical protein